LASGLKDPVTHFKKEVELLNLQRKEEKTKKISKVSPLKNIGYFPFVAILNNLKVKKFLNLFNLATDFKFDICDLLSSLIYARSILPCSKSKTFHDVLPNLYHGFDYSYDQLLDGLSFVGSIYEKLVVLFTTLVNKVYGIKTDKTYFDCTNFYFEIDREDNFRRKGPSKENRKDPLVGLGLLLDSNQIPVGMKLYPGNQSEKPVLREVIDQLKKCGNLTGRTIHVADKGLNCAQNIGFSKESGDGYLFSKSVKMLPSKEKVWVLNNIGFQSVLDKKGNIAYSYKSCVDEFPYSFVQGNKTITIKITEKRLLTFNPTLAKKQIAEINKLVEKAGRLTRYALKKDEYGESAKYVSFKDENGNKATVAINQSAIDEDISLAGYNLLVTSETKMPDAEIYNIYHNLWRIEESFKIMKSELDARPVFVQKENSIKGHFLICYLSVLLERIFQFKILGNEFSTEEIFEFIKKFRVTKNGKVYMNVSTSSELLEKLVIKFGIPLDNLWLTEAQIKSIFECKLK
jgi:transposase